MFVILYFNQIRVIIDIIYRIRFIIGETNPKVFLIDRVLIPVIDLLFMKFSKYQFILA